MERIRKKSGGVLTAHAVVSAATRADSPLHKHFEWDDDIAADKFRLEQGRHLFRCARVKVEGAGQEAPTLVRVYINPMNDGLYHTVAEVMGSDDLREQALRKVMMELRAMQTRNAEFQQLFEVLAKAEQEVEGLRTERSPDPQTVGLAT